MGRRTCAEAHCDRPIAWAEGHHRTPWALGGTTTVKELILLCPWHHHRAHDPDYTLTPTPHRTPPLPPPPNPPTAPSPSTDAPEPLPPGPAPGARVKSQPASGSRFVPATVPCARSTF